MTGNEGGASHQNHKLVRSAIVSCPEIEAALPCVHFNQGLCPGCFAEALWPVRRANWSGRQRTPARGLIRLGTWKEVLPHEWTAFKRGEGTTPEGRPWRRPDFPTRRYFLVTRGLLPLEFYRRVAADPFALNIQCSVDVLRRDGGEPRLVPDEARLLELAGIPKVLFRFKTLVADTFHGGVRWGANVQDFAALAERLGLDRMRVLETPLRLGRNRGYQTATPLEEAGWSSASFLRCNTACQACPSTKRRAGENRVLGCAVTPSILPLLQKVGNEARPYRATDANVAARIAWKDLVLASWRSLGGTVTVEAMYEAVRAREPRVVESPLWKERVRERLQRYGLRVGPATWRLREAAAATGGVGVLDEV